MNQDMSYICVCICTFKRPDMLCMLLQELENQKICKEFTYSIVVVDNDKAMSAKNIVATFQGKSNLLLEYYVEPEQNIALARNKAILNSKGDFIAFIDDDEIPERDWLLNLYNAQRKFQADGILGPVKPRFEMNPPAWVLKGKLLERKSFKSGMILKNYRDTRTGNALLSKKIFDKEEIPFDPTYGRTGGEDTDFFKRIIEGGSIIIWCNEACVYEIVPSERLKRGYLLKRALLRGVVAARRDSFSIYHTMKSFLAFLLYTLFLPFSLLFGQHIFMKYLVKNCDHIGKLLAICGVNVMKERTF